MNKVSRVVLSAMLCIAVIIGLVGCGATQKEKNNIVVTAKASTRVITDAAGRKVTIPTKINRVYCAVPTADSMMCTLAPEKLVAWTSKPSDEAKKYLSKKVANLPALGGWMGKKVTANAEDVIKVHPDVIIYLGTFTNGKVDFGSADTIQQQTGIPVIVLDDAFDKTAETYRKLGDYLGVKKRAEKLAKYCEDKTKEIKKMVAKIPKDKRANVYYAEGQGGLSTDPSGSCHTEVLDLLKVNNVAKVDNNGGVQNMVPVSMEQVLGWNPDVILVNSMNASNYNEILTNKTWSNIKAVKDKKVYMTPSIPFNWFDRPPCMMRYIGIQWFGNVLYPKYVQIDLKKEIKDFFKLFYQVDLTDKEVDAFIPK